VEGSRSGRWRGSLGSGLCSQEMWMKHDNVKQEEELKHKLRTQIFLECYKSQKAKTRTPHSRAQTFGAVLIGSYRSAEAGAV